MNKCSITFLFLLFFLSTAVAQRQYSYKVDLTKVDNDKLTVELFPPSIDQKSVNFYMPKIIPGTYSVSDYGKFLNDLQAFDKRGKKLSVERLDENTWRIDKAKKISRITYSIDDTYDTDIAHQIYPMAGTNIEDDENFVIATPGFFGYFENIKEIPFEISFTKPEIFYGSTGLKPVSSTATEVIYRTEDYDQLVDSPIMFNAPDTTVVNVGNARILVSVYSPNKMVTSQYMARHLRRLLNATKDYLGGSLPVEKYAFIYYFDDSETPQPGQGALEHSYSSFYYLSEMPQQQMIDQLIDIAAHEFFHIVTPLTIHSKEIADFNFNVPELSRHLWLYEGVTEYSASHVQVQHNLITVGEYLEKLQEKILVSKTYFNDTLPFTELSLKSADEHQEEYTNVYEKGALIAAMLDIQLNELSGGEYDLQQLLHQLGQRFGKDKAFRDEELFDIITGMTYPEIADFFERYVAGNEKLPYQEYFQKVGIQYIPEATDKRFTLGNIKIGYDPASGNLFVADISEMNNFGRAIGFKQNDHILAIEGVDFTPTTGQQLLYELSNTMREGDTLDVVISRDGKKQELHQKVFFVEVPIEHQLSLMENPSMEQLRLRNQWLMANPVTARPQDVSTIDSIMFTLYDVISGPAGERNWERFHSLFAPEARLKALAPTPYGNQYILMTPEEYEQNNSPVFQEVGFFEEEIGRTVNRFGDIAQVFSAYQYKMQENGPVVERGINSIQLAFFQDRWWITSILWLGEDNYKIPQEYLFNK